MADPVKSDEIEDVLSSIRRLVSEHQPPTTAVNASDDAHAPDKLVLTPALRVTDPEDPWVPIAAQSDLAEDTAELPRSEGIKWAEELWGDENSGADPDFDPQLQADIWEAAGIAPQEIPEEAVETAHDEATMEPDESLFLTSEEVEEPMGEILDAEEFVAPAPVAKEPEDGDAEIAEDVADGWDDDAAMPDDGLTALDDDMAEAAEEGAAPPSFIRSSASSLVDYEPEEGAVSPPDEAPPVATLELAEARAAQKTVAEVLLGIAPDAGEEDAAELEPEFEPEPEIEPVPEPEETSETEIEADLVDDTMPLDFLADEPEPESEQAPDASPEDLRSAVVEDLGASPFSFPDDEDSFVDEDTLREIVADVVREELQGEMGKRITRNIRKMVRREIRIALATDDLEE